MSKGFVIVASNAPRFAWYAHTLALSLLDFYPTAKIHLFTEKQFLPLIDKHFKNGTKIYDDIGYCNNAYRAKMLCCSKVNYDQVCYLDADMWISDEMISHVFDNLNDTDMLWTKIREMSAADHSWWDWRNGVRHPHGGFFVWNNSDKMKEFFKTWYEHFYEWHLVKSPEEWTEFSYTFEQRHWDQISLHAMLMNNNHRWYRPDIKWKWIDDYEDWRWNYIDPHYEITYNYDPSKKIINHYAKSSVDKTIDKIYNNVDVHMPEIFNYRRQVTKEDITDDY